MFSNIQLDKLIDINILQNIQDMFAKATHVAAITVDYEGKPITRPSNFTGFCNEIRSDEKLREKCYKCDAYGGIQSLINRKPHIYKCHAGLFDFSVPIVIENNYAGAIMGGQVKIENEDDERIGTFGKMSKWDGNELNRKYNEISAKTYEDVEYAANLIYQISKYMVEHEYISMIKKELNSKATKLMEEENKSIKLEKALKEAELKALQYQVNPHFMFNALNTIQNLAYIENAKKTQNLIYNFSDMIKYTLRKDNSNITYLEEEIKYVENYMKIQIIRFGDKIGYKFDVDAKYYQIKCPFMLLQPIVENFIKYVVEQKIDGGYINIKGYENNNDFIIDIWDNGDGMSEEKIESILDGSEYRGKKQCIGLNNINKRLIYLYGNEYRLNMYSQNMKGQGLLIKIKLPMDEGGVIV